MHAVLSWSILAIGSIFLGLTTLIVCNKAWREAREGYRRARRRALEPKVLAWVHGDKSSLIAALGGPVRRRDREVMERILLDHAQRVRGVEQRRLSQALEELGYVEHFLDGLLSRRWWRRADAAEKLGLAGATRAADSLAAAMRDESPEVRMRAAKSLGMLGSRASVRELVHALQETNRWSTIRIADILAGMGRKVVEELTATFPSLVLPGKLAVLDILGRVRPLHAAPWLVERLDDPEVDVRARACHALGCIGDPNRAYELTRALDDTDWPVRAMAAKALGRVRHTAAIPRLCGVLSDPEWWVRFNAAQALRAMGGAGLEALERALENPDRFARHQAVLVLQESGVVDRRVNRLASGTEEEKNRAREFVGRLVAAGQLDRLRALASEHPEQEVREALAALLPPEGTQREEEP
jgi:HEAT repeat protein